MLSIICKNTFIMLLSLSGSDAICVVHLIQLQTFISVDLEGLSGHFPSLEFRTLTSTTIRVQ